MFIHKMLDVSTSHITEETARKLDVEVFGIMDGMDLVVYKKECGWFVAVPSDLENLPVNRIPEDLKQCLEVAIEHDCTWIVFDCDVAVVEGLKTYEW